MLHIKIRWIGPRCLVSYDKYPEIIGFGNNLTEAMNNFWSKKPRFWNRLNLEGREFTFTGHCRMSKHGKGMCARVRYRVSKREWNYIWIPIQILTVEEVVAHERAKNGLSPTTYWERNWG